jgi:uncharacterized SAM-binding protein YcdF (DUF218 family)
MDDPVLTYFSQNLATISKEELLQALKNALESASYWREACLSGLSRVVAAGDDPCNASIR